MNTGTGRHRLRGNLRGWTRIEHLASIRSTLEPDNTGCSPKVVISESSRSSSIEPKSSKYFFANRPEDGIEDHKVEEE